jgi:hypothetical protein
LSSPLNSIKHDAEKKERFEVPTKFLEYHCAKCGKTFDLSPKESEGFDFEGHAGKCLKCGQIFCDECGDWHTYGEQPICGECYNKEITAPNLAVWSFLVLKRDGNKCIKCGSTENLEAHHIKSKNEYPALIFNINNGITLCHKCHSQAHAEMRKFIDILGISEEQYHQIEQRADDAGVSKADFCRACVAWVGKMIDAGALKVTTAGVIDSRENS